MDYDTIVALALSYSDRESDAEIPGKLDNFLKIVEARINRKLKTGDMTTRSTLDLSLLLGVGQDYFALPSDFGGIRDIEYSNGSDRITMSYINPEQMNQLITSKYNGLGVFYTIIANQFQVFPQKITGNFEIVYYQNVPALSAIDTTNWISDDNPDVYHFGLTVEISSFVKDKEASALWDQRFQTSLNEITEEDSTMRWSGTPLRINIG